MIQLFCAMVERLKRQTQVRLPVGDTSARRAIALRPPTNGEIIARQILQDSASIYRRGRSVVERFMGGITILHAKKEEKKEEGGEPTVTPQQLKEAAKKAIEKASTMTPDEQVTTTVHKGDVYVTKTSTKADKPEQK